jgi:mannose-1-phosphate guanylyltransferase
MAAWVVIMAGGGGTRLWPLSRRKQPKQFLALLPGGETLLGATVRRCAPLAPLERVLIVTAASQVESVRRVLPSLPEANIVVEPEARNTAPCIGLGALSVVARDPDGVMAVLPSDQFVADEPAFVTAARQAIAVAERGEVVTVGITPLHPETGFGYIQCGDSIEGNARRVVRFVEKPDKQTAEGYLASGHYLWNAGMFFFAARRILDEIRRRMPDLSTILDGIAADPSRAGELYPKSPKVSIDYGVMEKLGGAMAVVPADIGWSDVGSWAALADLLPGDKSQNRAIGETLALDGNRNLLVGEAGMMVSAIGVSDLVIVATRDAVLVLPRERAQDVKKIVEALETPRLKPYL